MKYISSPCALVSYKDFSVTYPTYLHLVHAYTQSLHEVCVRLVFGVLLWNSLIWVYLSFTFFSDKN